MSKATVPKNAAPKQTAVNKIVKKFISKCSFLPRPKSSLKIIRIEPKDSKHEAHHY